MWCGNGGAVFEYERDVSGRADGGPVDEDVPQARAELERVLTLDRIECVEVVQYGGVPALGVIDVLADLFKARGGLLELCF